MTESSARKNNISFVGFDVGSRDSPCHTGTATLERMRAVDT